MIKNKELIHELSNKISKVVLISEMVAVCPSEKNTTLLQEVVFELVAFTKKLKRLHHDTMDKEN